MVIVKPSPIKSISIKDEKTLKEYKKVMVNAALVINRLCIYKQKI